MKLVRSILYRFFHIINWMICRLNKVAAGKNLKVDGIVLIANKGVLQIGQNVRINSGKFKNIIGGDTRTSLVVKKGAQMVLGNNIAISNSALYCANKITIEDDVMIGGSCKIWDSDFHPIDPVLRKEAPNENFVTRPIHIKKGAFIGGCSIILKGVTIGENAVIGAGSVVSRSVPDNEIWAGNPATFIKKLKGYE